MAKLTVHGGDFKKGDGWFYPSGSFLLNNKEDKPEPIPLTNVEAAERASDSALRFFTGGESLHADFERSKVHKWAFIACFDDGRLLFASTDQDSFEQICAACAME
jgi:hypothetical protein